MTKSQYSAAQGETSACHHHAVHAMHRVKDDYTFSNRGRSRSAKSAGMASRASATDTDARTLDRGGTATRHPDGQDYFERTKMRS